MNTTPNAPPFPDKSPSQPILPPSSSRLPFIIGIIVVCIVAILVGIGSFFLGKSQNNQKIAKTSPSPISSLYPEPSRRATPDLYTESSRSTTANWKTFINTTKQISFNYPEDWDFYNLNNSDYSIALGPKQFIDENKAILNNRNLNMSSKRWPINLEIQQPNGDFPWNESSYELTSDEEKEVTERNIQINNQNVKQYVIKLKKDRPYFRSGEHVIVDIFQLNNRKYGFSLQEIQYQKIFNQILSTFKFIVK